MHAKNEFLQVCDFLADFPEVASRIVGMLKPEYLVDVMLMLHVRKVLEKSLFGVAALEARSNAERGLVTETFRTESPAILMSGALLSLDTLMDFKHSFVAEAAVKVMKKVGWTPKVLLKLSCSGFFWFFIFLILCFKIVEAAVEVSSQICPKNAGRIGSVVESARKCQQSCRYAQCSGANLFSAIHLSCIGATSSARRT